MRKVIVWFGVLWFCILRNEIKITGLKVSKYFLQLDFSLVCLFTFICPLFSWHEWIWKIVADINKFIRNCIENLGIKRRFLSKSTANFDEWILPLQVHIFHKFESRMKSSRRHLFLLVLRLEERSCSKVQGIVNVKFYFLAFAVVKTRDRLHHVSTNELKTHLKPSDISAHFRTAGLEMGRLQPTLANILIPPTPCSAQIKFQISLKWLDTCPAQINWQS